MNFNQNKTNFMILFEYLRSCPTMPVIFQEKLVKKVILMKYLGLWIDGKLNTYALINQIERTDNCIKFDSKSLFNELCLITGKNGCFKEMTLEGMRLVHVLEMKNKSDKDASEVRVIIEAAFSVSNACIPYTKRIDII
ncbi:unnamed protein product [Brachionus calyciflorus]|uniref:Uncharacterized protein n=1 Tax=Brachionus calyciflorus TaxID=104777 RepID=A0A814JNZ4_9BILA|nr:unnamed protein product [Brachionus calyciflorus]